MTDIDLVSLKLLASNEWCADLATVSVIASEALAEITRLRAASEWRDISTAPVLPLTDDLPSYYRFRCMLLEGDDYVFQGYAEYIIKRKKLVWKNVTIRGCSCQPTHWMPLPAPPQRNEVKK